MVHAPDTSVRRIRSAAEAIEALHVLPGGRELMQLGEERQAMLVGGAVRDLLIGRTPRELDVSVAAGAADAASELADALVPDAKIAGSQPEVIAHERFGTASVRWAQGRVDIAERRAESYAAPGALPDVRPGSVAEDLARRDFTVNALALALSGPAAGELIAAEHASEDLAGGVMRVLHNASFHDDPTRLLRLARYSVRLGFAIEPHTGSLAEQAVSAGALASVSGGRVAAELWLASEEPHADAYSALADLGVLGAIGLPARFDAALAEAAEALFPDDGDGIREILLMSVAFHPADDGPRARERAAALMERLEFLAGARERVLASAFGVSELANALACDLRPSRLHELLAGLPTEAIAIAGALGARIDPVAAEAARRWLDTLRHVHLQIGGEDLLRAGVPEGPAIGRALQSVLARRLDGSLGQGREVELAAAIEACS